VTNAFDELPETLKSVRYFRSNPTFDTASPAFDWLNRIIAVGIGHRRADGPLYSIFELL
jgi:hypothetical protein